MFGTDQPAPAATDLIKDVSEANFMAEVVEKSMTVPVIVDFWAPWCGPCRQLGPALEAAVTAAKGKVVMAKVNVDENQGISSQLRIQSIPTVYAFWQGQPVDGFQGALPASELQKFVEKLSAMAGDGGLADAIAAAEEMLGEGAAEDAAETFAAIFEEDPKSAEALGGLIRAKLALGKVDEAQALVDGADPALASSGPVEAAKAQLQLALQAADAGPLGELEAAVYANPDDHQARFDYAQALHAAGNVEEAVEQLLDLFRRDREWNDGAAKAQLFTIFDALKPNDPIAQKGRRRLSSMIFA
ncbi:thioredoxin [Pseudothioclava nitratireducens]|uniref:thioredoxin n=1 Tax=Pseudothioclava nitratireducens TaxID=1928646 RepID=UPI0023D9CF81|nr:thioredoxin [Defluviimonas nitratireducens]MDF1620330.1 thioredoxin [Defluviimonas nitratireducens]